MKRKLAMLMAVAMVIAMLPAIAWGSPTPVAPAPIPGVSEGVSPFVIPAGHLAGFIGADSDIIITVDLEGAWDAGLAWMESTSFGTLTSISWEGPDWAMESPGVPYQWAIDQGYVYQVAAEVTLDQEAINDIINAGALRIDVGWSIGSGPWTETITLTAHWRHGVVLGETILGHGRIRTQLVGASGVTFARVATGAIPNTTPVLSIAQSEIRVTGRLWNDLTVDGEGWNNAELRPVVRMEAPAGFIWSGTPALDGRSTTGMTLASSGGIGSNVLFVRMNIPASNPGATAVTAVITGVQLIAGPAVEMGTSATVNLQMGRLHDNAGATGAGNFVRTGRTGSNWEGSVTLATVRGTGDVTVSTEVAERRATFISGENAGAQATLEGRFAQVIVGQNLADTLFSDPVESLRFELVQDGVTFFGTGANAGEVHDSRLASTFWRLATGQGWSDALAPLDTFGSAALPGTATLLDITTGARALEIRTLGGGAATSAAGLNLRLAFTLTIDHEFQASSEGSVVELRVLRNGVYLGTVTIANVFDPIDVSVDSVARIAEARGTFLPPFLTGNVTIAETAFDRIQNGRLYMRLIALVNGRHVPGLDTNLSWSATRTVNAADSRRNTSVVNAPPDGPFEDDVNVRFVNITGLPYEDVGMVLNLDSIWIDSAMYVDGMEIAIEFRGPALGGRAAWGYRTVIASTDPLGPAGALPARIGFGDGQRNLTVVYGGQLHPIAQVLATGYTTDGAHRNILIAPRWVASVLGTTQAWDELEQSFTMTLGDISVTMFMNQSQAIVNGQSVDIADFVGGGSGAIGTVIPQNINGNMMLPARFIGYVFGYTVTPNADLTEVVFTLE